MQIVSEIICIKQQILFSGKNQKHIINLSSAELPVAQKVQKEKLKMQRGLTNVKTVYYINIVLGFFYLGFIREYFTHIEPMVHQRWEKTGEPAEKPPDHP